MDTVKKKLILPLIIFVGIMVVNISSIIGGIEAHQTWRIVVATVSSAIMIAAFILILVRLTKLNREQKSGK